MSKENEVIEVKKVNALKAFNEADASSRTMLANLLGKEHFLNIKDRIQSFEDALSIDGETDKDVLWLINYKGTHPDMISASNYMKAVILVRVYNEGWVADFEDDNQPKWQVYFRHKPGFGLSYHDYDGWTTVTFCGGRLCFKDKEKCEYVTTKHPEIFRDFLTINK
jgi:hypothetical protein